VVAAATAFLHLVPRVFVWDLTYAGMVGALLAGTLLTARPRAGQPGGSLLIVPVLVGYARFGGPLLPALAFTALVGHVARGTSIAAALCLASQDVVAFALAHTLVESVHFNLDPAARLIVFALVFVLLRSSIYRFSSWFQVLPEPSMRQERPDAFLSLLIAPLSGIPLLVLVPLGDGGLLLALAALLLLFAVVCETVNSAMARSEADADRERWQKAHAFQSELTKLVTHEVRNPLTTIMISSQLADRALRADPSTDARAERHVKQIRAAAMNAGSLVDTLLELSRLESLDQLPLPEPIEIEPFFRSVVADLEVLADVKGQMVEVQVRDGAASLEASPGPLRVALTNLMSNAVKYTPEGGKITIWARRDGVSGVLLGVADNGIGISPEDVSRLFTRFFRSDDPRVRAQRGVGLGLALTRSIVERMGGRLTVTSAINQGSTFCISLPRVVLVEAA
jgi:signal transduction histidine kinase